MEPIKKPKIIEGICEFCGVPANTCIHFGNQPAQLKQAAKIDIKPVASRKGDPLKKKAADIIIAHWDRRDMLYQTLGSIPLSGLNVVIVRGSTYSVANNIGARAALTDNLIFCNDDMIVPRQTLLEMLSSPADFVIARQFYPDGSPQFCGLEWVDNDFKVVTDPAKADAPTSGCYRIKRKVFEDLGGFNEEFINGGEDHHLFFSALEKGYTFEFADTPVIHYSSQSDGRFDYEAENFRILRKLWPNERLAKLFYEIKNKKEKRA